MTIENRADNEPVWHAKWPDNVPKSLYYPSCTLGDFLKQSVEKHGHNTAIVFLNVSVTYELYQADTAA